MIKPHNVRIEKIDDSHAEVYLVINEDLLYFKGHFNIQPILPGVAQLGWITEFSEEIFKIKLTADFPVIKFTAPILPKDRICLLLNYDRDKKRINFEYKILNQNIKASSGKVCVSC